MTKIDDENKKEQIVTTKFIWHQVCSEWKPDWFKLPEWNGYDSGNLGDWFVEPFEKIRDELKLKTNYEINVTIKIKELDNVGVDEK